MNTRDHVQRYDRLVGDASTHLIVCQELAEYLLPTRSNITFKRTPGGKQGTRVFDSTGIRAAKLLASALAGSLTSPVVRWFSLRMRLEELNKIEEIADWLEECADICYEELNQSNFKNSIHEGYLDLAVFGSMCMFEDEKEPKGGKFGGLRFTTIPMGEFVVAEDSEGRVDTVYRKIALSYRSAADKFGIENLSEQSQARAKSAKTMDDMLTILHCAFPRTKKSKVVLSNKQFPHASLFIEYDNKHLLLEEGYHENPFFVPRWLKTSGEVLGRGPGHEALPDVRTLNRADELLLRNWAKAVDPPLMVLDDGVIGRVSLVASGLTVVRDMNALKPIESGAKFDVSINLGEQRRRSIEKTFYVDQLQIPDKNYMTAFEVDKQLELMQRILGPTVGRLDVELLSPIVYRTFNILMRAKRLPDYPQALLSYKDKNPQKSAAVDILYDGPLARAQRGSEVVSIQKLVQTAAPLVEVDPTVQDNLDSDQAYRFIAEKSGVPLSLMRDDKGVKEIRKQRTAAQNDQANQQKILNASQAAKNVGSIPQQEGQPVGAPADESAQGMGLE